MGRGFHLGGQADAYTKKIRWLVLLPVGFGLAWAWQWYNRQPVVGVITTSIPTAGEVKADTTAAPGRYRSENLSFAYPAIYSDSQNTAPAGTTIEQYSMTAHMEKTESRRISLMVKTAEQVGAMREDSAYKFRLNSIDNYQLAQETTAKNLQTDVFSKKDGGEVTYFIAGPGKYLIVAATSNIANGDYKNDVKSVIDSVVWN
ncbi:MAG: hypothetical protein KIH63_004000 [Candidatus Saccharibacteria bacterium]|nr:hypothetical protein [Candidatus Saccharibacteria bacterium]